MKLSEMVEIVVNNNECVVLKVKENQTFNLITLGCFNGNETILRLTKGRDHTCTVWEGEKNYSWHWGERGYTLVSDNLSKKGHLIERTIEDDFEIYIGSNQDKIRETLWLEKPKGLKNHYKLMCWKDNFLENVCIHKNNEFWRYFSSLDSFEKYIKELGGRITKKGNIYHSSQTGCALLDIDVIFN